MSNRAKVAINAIAGLLAGALVWYTLERTNLLLALSLSRAHHASATTIADLLTGALFGLMLGAAGALSTTAPRTRIAVAIATPLAATLVAPLAFRISQTLPSAPVTILATPGLSGSTIAAVGGLAHPALAWAVLGLVLGSVPSLARLAWQDAVKGAIGGFLGGAIAGVMLAKMGVGQDNALTTASLGLHFAAFALGGALIGGLSVAGTLLAADTRTHRRTRDNSETDPTSKTKNVIALPEVANATTVQPNASPSPNEPLSEQRGSFDAAYLTAKTVAELTATTGPHAGERYAIPAVDNATVGADPACTVSLASDPAVSAFNAVLIRRDNKHYLADTDSRNGTYLNATAVNSTPRPLYDGDIVMVGETELRYERVE